MGASLKTMTQPNGSSLADHLDAEVARDAALADTAATIRALAAAAIEVSEVVGRGALAGDLAAQGEHNSDGDVQKALDFFLENDRLVITLCHGPAVFVAGGLDRESNPFAGYQVVAFPDSLDFGANVDIGYIPGKMPWKLGETLRSEGLEVVNDDMSGRCTTDRNVITGDSPLAANELGRRTATALLEKARARA